MTEVLRLTNSEMGAWRDDPRFWYLAYYLGLQKKEPMVAGRAITRGNRYHDALAEYYDPDKRIHPVVTVEKSIERDLAAAPWQEVDILKEGDLVKAMVEGYIEWLAEEGEDEDLEILATETKVEVPLVDGINLLSKLDARVQRRSTNRRLALEHKSNFYDIVLLQNDTQCLTEHLVEFLDLKEKGEDPHRAEGILYNMARPVKRTAAAKPPFYKREDVIHNDHELRAHWRHCVSIGNAIQNARTRLDAGETHHTVCPPSVSRESTWKNPFLRIYTLMD